MYNRNLPVWSSYEPGSTFKIITLAAALEEGKVDLEKEHFMIQDMSSWGCKAYVVGKEEDMVPNFS